MFGRLTFFLCGLAFASAGRLSIQGTQFIFDGQHVFLSGSNFPWVGNYLGSDFWDNDVSGVFAQQLQELTAAGANSIRAWIHGVGDVSPARDGSGHVTGLDAQGNNFFIGHFTQLLDIARQHDVLVFPTLWSAASAQGDSYLDEIIADDSKLQSYIDNALTPWVNAVKNHPALGGWDIINEPEAILIPNQNNAEPCYNSQRLSGAGYGVQKFGFERLLRFINLQAAAIKAADPTALVTVGTWDPKSNIDSHGYFNHYKDECLVKAGGRAQGTLDFWQFHNYARSGGFDNTAVFNNAASDYNTNKPIVVGEFWHQGGDGWTDHDMFTHIYNNGYHGAWVLVHTIDPELDSALASIAHLTHNGVIPINV